MSFSIKLLIYENNNKRNLIQPNTPNRNEYFYKKIRKHIIKKKFKKDNKVSDKCRNLKHKIY